MGIRPPDVVYVNEPYLSIRWDGVHHHVYSEWRTFVNSAELRTGMLKGLTAINDNRASAYVCDARKVKLIAHSDQKWIKEIWMPQAVRAGLQRLAFVTAPSGLGKVTVGDVAESIDDHGLQSRTFDSMEAAAQWVSAFPATR